MKEENWIYVDNKKCPVRADVYVIIEDDLGNVDSGLACQFDWLIQEPGCRIVKYRVA